MELTAAWQTEELPRERLTVADEREQILFYLVEVLYRVVPAFYEEIAQALEKLYGTEAGSARVPAIRPCRILGGRRHGRQPRRARQEHPRGAGAPAEIGRASCRERV